MTSPIITEAEKDVLKSKDFNIYTSEGLVVRLEYNPWFAILHFKEIAKLDRDLYFYPYPVRGYLRVPKGYGL